jgi:serine/threonine protein kinase
MNPVESPEIIKSLDEDPYKHIADLGDGAYGIVDKVERGGIFFARKKIRFSTGRDREKTLRTTQKEFTILNRLKHRHVIEVIEIFQCKNRLRIIMAQVADTDLGEYMERVDSLQVGAERDAMRKSMQTWPGCLIQAVDYLHEMRVKHRDLKPANILIMGDQVLITDFGVSKDLIDEETTASLTGAALAGTPLYWAPELDPESESLPQRRGRAVDIFALGCIFLEMATIFMAPPGSRTRFSQHRATSGMRAYRWCPKQILQWIWYLLGRWSDYGMKHDTGKTPHDTFIHHGSAVCDLSFLMMDPNPKMRITARQLVALLHTEDLYYFASIKQKSCILCRPGMYIGTSNLPLHSRYKDTDDLRYPDHRKEEALSTDFLPDWEAAKKEWLQDHMWW